MDTALHLLSRVTTVFLTGFTLVLLTALVVTIGPERGTTISLTTSAVVALPLGAAAAMAIRRGLARHLRHLRLDTVMIIVTAVELLAAELAVISTRESLAVTLLALASGSVAGLTAHRTLVSRPPRWVTGVLGAGGIAALIAFTVLGITAITVSAVVVTFYAAAVVALHTSADVEGKVLIDA